MVFIEKCSRNLFIRKHVICILLKKKGEQEKMKLRRVSIAVLFAATLLMMSAFPLPSVAAKGPREEDLILFYYANVESAYAALEANEIDIVGYEITQPLYESAIANPNVVLGGVADTGFYELDLNNNYSIHSYPGMRQIMSYRAVRRAVAWVTDKDYIVDVICGGFAERIDAMVAAPSKAWANESYWNPNYPYEYDPAAAAAELDAAGFVEGSTPNPDYDPAFPGSAEYIRTYPSGHSKAGSDLDPLKAYVRDDDLRRLYAGRMVCENLQKLGIPVEVTEGDLGTLKPKVMVEKDYQLYTGGWDVGFYPLYLYTIYHSNYWQEGVNSPNYVTGRDASGNPMYPIYDSYASQVYYALTYEDAVSAAKLATGYWTEECINVPLWSSLSYWAWSKNVLGVVNMEGNGPENGYSFMNAYKTDGSPIRYGPKSAPNAMNQIYSSWYYDYQNLDRMNLYGGVDAPPYDLATNQAGFVQDWEVSLWDDGGVNKTLMKQWFRDDSYFVEPVTGNQKSQANASDYFFSCWYIYADPTAWTYSTVQDVHHINIVNDQHVEIYFDNASYWFVFQASPMILPVDTWLQSPLAEHNIETFVEDTNLTTPGAVDLSGSPVWIVSVTADGTPLTMFTDYNIVKGELYIYTDLSTDTVVQVDYWAYGDPTGFTAGGLPWETIFEGAGMYYATAFTPGTGNSITLKRNPYYWMDTPLLGEVDFVWNFQSGPKPRSGSYQINIYDVVMAAGAYGSQGTGVPSSNWLAGADVAPEGGVIDIYDIVTITGKYGQSWGAP